MVKYLLLSLFLIGLNTNSLISLPYYPTEVPEPAVKQSVEFMRSTQGLYWNVLRFQLNMGTPGFIESGAYHVRSREGKLVPGTYYKWRNSAPLKTNRELDFYLDSVGHGFFMYRLPGNNIGYSRDGRFELDSNQRLVSVANEFPILSDNGDEIYLPPGEITVSRSGILFVNGDPISKLGIAMFPDEERNKLVALNGVIFIYSSRKGENTPPLLIRGEEHYSVRQYFSERSNSIMSLIGDTNLYKYSYEASSKAGRSVIRRLSNLSKMSLP